MEVTYVVVIEAAQHLQLTIHAATRHETLKNIWQLF